MQACKKVNLTVSYTDYPKNEFGSFDPVKKKFEGQYAWAGLDNHFLKRKHETQEEVLKYCTFRRFEEEGRLLPNGSWTGAIGDVVARQSDVTLRFQNQLIKPGLVDFTTTYGSEDLLVGHYIDERPKTRPIINFEAIWNILAPSAGFLLEYLAVFAFSLAFVYLLGRFLKKKGAFVSAFACNLFTGAQPFFRRSVVGLFSVCSLLFFFWVKQILANNVKTDKVIVSDEPILDTFEKLIRTDKELCLPLQEDIDSVLQPNGSLSREFDKIVNEKMNKKHPCCLFDYLGKMEKISGKDFFVMHGETLMNSLKIFNSMVRKDIFISDRNFGSPLIVFYMSKSIAKQAKAEFNRQVYVQIEGGFKFKAFREVNHIVDQRFPPIKSIFRNAREYIKFYTLISDVKMNDFTFVYLFYICQGLILLIFILHCNIRRIRRLLRKCKRFLIRLIGSTIRALNKVKNKIRLNTR